jgi:hypothetical protein
VTNRRTFGKRTGNAIAAPAPAVATAAEARVVKEPSVEHEVAQLLFEPLPLSAPREQELPSVEDEIREWKKSRGPVVALPWRQIALMASLCFGIASFVLPSLISELVQWPLYGLTLASLIAGLAKRSKNPN